MVSKISFNKFSLGYSISSFLITFGTMTLFKSITTNLFFIGANLSDLFIYLAFITGFSFILAFLAPLLGHISDKKKQGSRRSPYLIFGIVGMSLVTFLYYFSPLNFGLTDLFLNISYFAILHGIYIFSSIIFNIGFRSLLPEMFQDLNSRSNVIVLLLGFSALASFIIVILEVFISLEEIYFGIIFGLLIILGGIILFRYGFDEPYLRLSEKPKSNEHASYKILSSSNKLFIWFLIAFFFITISEILIENALFYIWPIYLENITPSLIEITTFFSNIIPSVSIIAFLLYWRKLSLSIGIKKLLKILMLALLVFTIALLFLFDLVSGFILTFLINGCLSGLNFVKLLFLAIIIDHYFLNTGNRREATYFALNNSFNLISGFIGLFLGQIITVFSMIFTDISGPNGFQDYYFFSKIGLSLIALIFIGISMVLIRKIPLDIEKYNNIEKEITEMNA
jgi:Na+/melibiose symporter-like transporter